jgi:peptide chain release factor 3
MTNFGVESLLKFIAENAAPPAPREARLGDEEITVEPCDKSFSGFIFKIQANMNPRHHDRVAFMRVVSGRFNRGMDVVVGRSAEKLRLAKPHSFMAQERSIVDEAWPGDIVGLYDPGKLRIGDTLAEGRVLKFGGIPRFAPEHFSRVILNDPLKRKQLNVGLEQLSHEGVIQAFYRPAEGRQDPWLGAVGVLQFEVLKERLKNEYSVDATLESLPYHVARWIGGSEDGIKWLKSRRNFTILEDRNGHPVLLAETAWAIDFAQREQPELEFYDVEPL